MRWHRVLGRQPLVTCIANVHVSYLLVLTEFSFFFLWLAHQSMLATCLWLEYCRAWFSELSFSRISESTTGYTFTPCVGSFTSPGIDTRQKGPPAFSVASERHRQMWGERNCLSFKTAVGGIEPPSPRLTVWCSTTRPLLLPPTEPTMNVVDPKLGLMSDPSKSTTCPGPHTLGPSIILGDKTKPQKDTRQAGPTNVTDPSLEDIARRNAI